MKAISFNVHKSILSIWVFLFYTGITTHSMYATPLLSDTNITKLNHNNVPVEVHLSNHWFFPEKVRGINTTYKYLVPSVVETLSTWNINVIRINIGSNTTDKEDFNVSNPLKGYRDTLQRLESVLPICRETGIGVIISLSGVPGRKLDYFWHKTDMDLNQKNIGAIWKALALRYKDEPSVIAYDLFNEPNYKPKNESVWYEGLLPELLHSVRSVDKTIPLIIEPGPWGLPKGFRTMQTIDDPNIIYSFHHYAPHNYTHQGVGKHRKSSRGKLNYPGTLQMLNTSMPKYWNKQELKNSMNEALRFQEKNNVRILVGEFGVARWAPGREQWVKDSIDIFEEYGWDWCFHSYAGWNGWNPTFGPDDKESNLQDGGKRTKTLDILQYYYRQNKPVKKGKE